MVIDLFFNVNVKIFFHTSAWIKSIKAACKIGVILFGWGGGGDSGERRQARKHEMNVERESRNTRGAKKADNCAPPVERHSRFPPLA